MEKGGQKLEGPKIKGAQNLGGTKLKGLRYSDFVTLMLDWFAMVGVRFQAVFKIGVNGLTNKDAEVQLSDFRFKSNQILHQLMILQLITSTLSVM